MYADGRANQGIVLAGSLEELKAKGRFVQTMSEFDGTTD